uniref:Putative sulfatase n=1 Tax=uncultured bacterium FLS12 TaxID=651659 RepID=C5HLB2_9BACT|nr:putative sulfatase [uncultured bacterium FLS12]
MPESTQRTPNLVMVMVDQLQAQRMKLYGGTDLLTPHFDRLASEGALFSQAITTSPLCTPSRISFWTGQYPSAVGGMNNGPLPLTDVPHLPGMLKAAGYHTALIGKNHCFRGEVVADLFDATWDAGHGGAQGGKDDPDILAYERTAQLEFLRMCHGRIVDLPDHVTTTARATKNGLAWLEEQGDDPFFLWLSYPEPHSPFVTTRNWADLYDPAKLTLPESWRSDISDKPAHFQELHELMGAPAVSDDELRELTQIYYGMASQIDDGLGQVLDCLERKGLADDTIVVFVSDHGEYIGSNYMLQKSAHLPEALIRVPLAIRWPGHVPSGAVYDDPVEHHDMMPTLCTLMGFDVPDSVQAADLTPLFDGKPFARDAAYSEIGHHADREMTREKTYAPDLPWAEARAFYHFVFGHYAHVGRGIRTRTHKYVAYEYGEKELYDLANDPEEMVNLAGKPAAAEIEADLAARLEAWSDAHPICYPDYMASWEGTHLREMLKKGFSLIPDAT